MKMYSKLRETLIETVGSIVKTELTGYIVYVGGKITLEHPDYSEEKQILIDMINDCEAKMGLFEPSMDQPNLSR